MTEPPLKQGDIILAHVPDEHGRNHKLRRVVIVTPTAEISSDQPLYAVAVTGSIDSVPENCAVPLRWRSNGHPQTGLTKAVVAACQWIVEIDAKCIEKKSGMCSTPELDQILLALARMS